MQTVFRQYFSGTDFKPVVDWFEMGGNVKFSDDETASSILQRMEQVPGLLDSTSTLAASRESSRGLRASAAEFILEGLHSMDKISRSEERGFAAHERKQAQDLYRDYTMDRSRHKKPLN